MAWLQWIGAGLIALPFVVALAAMVAAAVDGDEAAILGVGVLMVFASIIGGGILITVGGA